jgi:phosphomevalonate kinase
VLSVIAISGKRFAGKDTLAAMLPGPRYAFAAESKRMFAAARPEVDLARLLGDRAYKEQWRPQLTAFTVDALARDPLVFCREVAQRIADGGVPAVISDLRLRLEVDHLRPRFALHVVRLVRSDAARTASGWRWTAGVDDHSTETELDDPALWDEQIANDGTLDELAQRAARIRRAT